MRARRWRLQHVQGSRRDIEVAVDQSLGAIRSAACRIARISAWAVGSRSVRVRLPAVAMTLIPHDHAPDRDFAAFRIFGRF